MNKTKKILTAVSLVVLTVAAVIPSTYSWYTHNSSVPIAGNKIQFEDSTMPVSMKTASSPSSIQMRSYETDKDGKTTSDGEISSFTIAANSTQYYKTVFTNTSTSDNVMVDLNIAGLGNNSDYYVGTTSPTINEKCYASRATRTKATSDTFRVYFKSNRAFYPYWTKYDPSVVANDSDGDNETAFFTDLSNDMNVAYKLSTENVVHYKKLTICDNYSSYSNALLNHDGYSDENTKNTVKGYIDHAVFYADIPNNAEYFFFFNHYYRKDADNKNWNSTINITDFSQGKLYQMTGKADGNDYKLFEVGETDQNLVALNQYYTDVQMSLGSNVTADIGLKKTSDDVDFVPEYFGSEIQYAVDNRSGIDSDMITINRDGLIIPKSGVTTGGTSRVKTTIKGRFGDNKVFYTIVSISSTIDQVPVMKNILVRVPGTTTPEGTDGDKIEVYWYIKNKSDSAIALGSVFFTV